MNHTIRNASFQVGKNGKDTMKKVRTLYYGTDTIYRVRTIGYRVRTGMNLSLAAGIRLQLFPLPAQAGQILPFSG